MNEGQSRQDASRTAVAFDGVWVAYGERVALRDVSVAISWGVRVGIVGPNGAGKSTFLQAIVGMTPLRRGVVQVGGAPAAAARSRVAYVPQREQIRWDFPVSVLDVVLMGRYGRLGWLRRPGAADRAIALAALERVSMAHHRDTHIAELSGGQQQRVFLARALAQEADVVLLDEPLNGLDATTYTALLDLLEEQRDQGKAVLMATHDLATARSWCDLVLFLNTDLIAAGPPAAVFTREVLTRTYGGAFVTVGDTGDRMMVVHDERHAH